MGRQRARWREVLDHPDVVSLFVRQHLVAEVAQLAEAGVSLRTVERARQRQLLQPVLTGVVALAGADLESFELRLSTIQLHLGPMAYVSHRTAARLYGMRGMPTEPIDVTVNERRQCQIPPWARLHATSWEHDDDVVNQRDDGVRVASPLRTLFGLATIFNDHRFERSAEDAWHLGLLTPGEAGVYLGRIRRSGRSGVRRMERWLEGATARPRPSQSGFEVDVVRACGRAGLPPPVRQHPLTLLSGEVVHLDAAWPAAKLAVEPGHSWWHGGNLRQRADQARDRACDAVGWRTLRYDESARNDLTAVGREVRQIHDLRLRQLVRRSDPPVLS